MTAYKPLFFNNFSFGTQLAITKGRSSRCYLKFKPVYYSPAPHCSYSRRLRLKPSADAAMAHPAGRLPVIAEAAAMLSAEATPTVTIVVSRAPAAVM
jgi:hypothetical protein